MRSRTSYLPYLFLIATLIGAASLPLERVQRVRSALVRPLSWLWSGLHAAIDRGDNSFGASGPHEAEMRFLEAENQLLIAQIAQFKARLDEEKQLALDWTRFQALSSSGGDTPSDDSFFARRATALARRLALQLQALPAQVVFREPTFRGHFLWINIGERENRALQQRIVGRNSPVLVGRSLVGLVERVEESLSRVRLISDPTLFVAVRAVRGDEQRRYLFERSALLLEEVLEEAALLGGSLSADEEALLRPALDLMHERGCGGARSAYLAKGELIGSTRSLWSLQPILLSGVGFNWDVADDEGEARALKASPPILAKGDLLVTTGLDGLFPEGLRVGIVAHVRSLREGACSYELEARPTAGNLRALSNVQVIAPVCGEGELPSSLMQKK